MRQTRIIMGMPITVEVINKNVTSKDLQEIFDYFRVIDKRFSPFGRDSEVSLINQHRVTDQQYSQDMKTVLKLAEQTKQQTKGYFDVWYNGIFDPSGIVKGWAIQQASKILQDKGFNDFYIDAGGDISAYGQNLQRQRWKIGIRNPFNSKEMVKVLSISNKGVATSGTSVKGSHIYNPLKQSSISIIQITVIGSNVYEADRMATAAFAMGKKGIYFIESLPNFEGYMIDLKGVATQTSHFSKYAED